MKNLTLLLALLFAVPLSSQIQEIKQSDYTLIGSANAYGVPLGQLKKNNSTNVYYLVMHDLETKYIEDDTFLIELSEEDKAWLYDAGVEVLATKKEKRFELNGGVYRMYKNTGALWIVRVGKVLDSKVYFPKKQWNKLFGKA